MNQRNKYYGQYYAWMEKHKDAEVLITDTNQNVVGALYLKVNPESLDNQVDKIWERAQQVACEIVGKVAKELEND